jgi:hypothetical protein
MTVIKLRPAETDGELAIVFDEWLEKLPDSHKIIALSNLYSITSVMNGVGEIGGKAFLVRFYLYYQDLRKNAIPLR